MNNYLNKLCEYLEQQGIAGDIEQQLRVDAASANKHLMNATRHSLAEIVKLYSKVLDVALIGQAELGRYPVIEGVSYAFLHHYQVIVVELKNESWFVTSNPLDLYPYQAVCLATDKKTVIKIAMPEHISRALERASSDKSSLGELNEELMEQSLTEALDDIDKLKNLASEAPIVRLVNLLVADAIKLNASDIHIEPFDRQLRIRYRIDGMLRDIDSPPAQSAAAIISRIKIMAKLDIAERRLPQDGRIKLNTHGHRVDLRISTIPSLHGESVVIRVLDQESLTLDFMALGFDERNVTQFRKLIERQQGIVLVTGPTGSGKTTTLYTALSELNVDTKKIMTVEDPIEYQLHGIIQMQTKSDIGLGFAATLRSVVRQDPDIIMIGEMRDRETTRIAMQSSLTGHFVLSTLHTNDVGSTITRLLDIGVEQYLITSTVAGIIAQRLVRKLCQSCKQAFDADEVLIENYNLISDDQGRVVLYRPQGCMHCGQTGYSGRTVIIEQLALCDEIRQAILKGEDGARLQQLARSLGMLTMREDGIRKAQTGLTSLEEVLRVTQGHE